MNNQSDLIAGLERYRTVTPRAENIHRVKHSVMVTLAACILLAGSADLFAQSRVFYDNFEANNTDLWSYDYSKCVPTARGVDGGGPRNGTYMVQCNWNGVAAWNDAANRSSLRSPSWRYDNEFLIRVWVRLDADVDQVNGAKIFRINNYPGHGMFAQNYWPSKADVFFHWDRVGDSVEGPLTWSGGNINDHLWHKYEIYHKNNTIGKTDGIIRMWFDGVLKVDYTGKTRANDGTQWNALSLMSNWSSNPGWEHDANNHVYWDDIEIYSDYGTGASGSMATATIASNDLSLSPPSNLRVIRPPDPQ